MHEDCQHSTNRHHQCDDDDDDDHHGFSLCHDSVVFCVEIAWIPGRGVVHATVYAEGISFAWHPCTYG